MGEILTHAFQLKAALEYHSIETDPSFEYHLEAVSTILVFGYDYVKKNPLEITINFDKDCVTELAYLFEMIENFEPKTKEEQAFKKLTQELIKL